MHGSYASNMALTECDLLINLGSRFDDRLASNPNEFAPHATVVHVDIDESEINKVISTDLGIVADCKKYSKLYLKDLQIKLPMNTGLTIVLKISTNILLNIKTDDTFCKPQEAIEYIGKITNGEAIVTTDVGQHQMWQLNFIHSNIMVNGLLAVV